jgi:hypothetical protein
MAGFKVTTEDKSNSVIRFELGFYHPPSHTSTSMIGISDDQSEVYAVITSLQVLWINSDVSQPSLTSAANFSKLRTSESSSLAGPAITALVGTT